MGQHSTQPELSEAARTMRVPVRNRLVLSIWAATVAEEQGEGCLHTVAGDNLTIDHPEGRCYYSMPNAAGELRRQLQMFEESDVEDRLRFRERALLLALLVASPLRPYVAESVVIAYNDPHLRGWPVLYVNHHSGQFTAHLHPLDLDLFASVPRVDEGDAQAMWCGGGKELELGQLDNLRLFLATGVRFSGELPDEAARRT